LLKYKKFFRFYWLNFFVIQMLVF